MTGERPQEQGARRRAPPGPGRKQRPDPHVPAPARTGRPPPAAAFSRPGGELPPDRAPAEACMRQDPAFPRKQPAVLERSNQPWMAADPPRSLAPQGFPFPGEPASTQGVPVQEQPAPPTRSRVEGRPVPPASPTEEEVRQAVPQRQRELEEPSCQQQPPSTAPVVPEAQDALRPGARAAQPQRATRGRKPQAVPAQRARRFLPSGPARLGLARTAQGAGRGLLLAGRGLLLARRRLEGAARVAQELAALPLGQVAAIPAGRTSPPRELLGVPPAAVAQGLSQCGPPWGAPQAAHGRDGPG